MQRIHSAKGWEAQTWVFLLRDRIPKHTGSMFPRHKVREGWAPRPAIFLNLTRCICIYRDMGKPATIPLSCMCSSFRRASRVLTQHYETAMRSLGLKATQFTLMQALSLAGEVSQGRLGEILAIDSTTL